jgi:hypothetical protein
LFHRNNDQSRYKHLVLCEGINLILSKKNNLGSNAIWNHPNARGVERQHNCYVWWTCVSKTVSISIGTDWVSILTYLLLYSYEANFMQELLWKTKGNWLDQLTLHVVPLYNLSLNSTKWWLCDSIYPTKLHINDTTDTRFTLYLEINTEYRWRT